jgi:hypothetical protein
VEAVSLDEELAEQVINNPDPAPRGDPMRMREWSPELEILTAMADRLGDVIQAVIAAQGGKPPKIKPMPRPKTAVEKLRDPRRQHRRTLSKVMIQQEDGTVLSAAEMAGARRGAMPMLPL